MEEEVCGKDLVMMREVCLTYNFLRYSVFAWTFFFWKPCNLELIADAIFQLRSHCVI